MATPLEGIHVALLTPFLSNESVDETVLAQLVEDQLSAGVHGLVVGGSTGEGFLLTEEEAQRALAVTLQVADGRVPVTAQIGALSTSQAVRNAKQVLAAGAQIGLLPPPFYEPLTDEELIRHYAAVAAVGLPIMIYNNPSAIGFSISPQVIARLARIDGVEYLKDTTPEAWRAFEIQRLTGGDIQVLNGQDSLALLGFLGGSRACVWGAPNAIPHVCMRLYELAVVRQDVPAARTLWSSLFPVLSFFEAEGYIPPVKAAAELRGIAAGPPRLPTLPLSDAKRAEVSGLLEALDSAMANSAADITV